MEMLLKDKTKLKVVYAITSSISLILMRGLSSHLSKRGLQCVVLTGEGSELGRSDLVKDIEVITIPFCREPSFFSDISCLLQCIRAFCLARPILVNTATPKAGLLVGIAAWLTGVPVRLFTLWGLRSETLAGAKGMVVRWTEWLSCRLSHRVVCVSHSLRAAAILQGIVSEEKSIVLGNGSSNGVDTEKYCVTDEETKLKARKRWSIAEDEFVLGFVGRLVKDKGISDLLELMKQIETTGIQCRCLIVGGFEEGDAVDSLVKKEVIENDRFILTGFLKDTRQAYAAMDVLILPSYREGFPNVVLEAGASGVPCVGYASTGIIDAVVDGDTGWLVPRGDVKALTQAVEVYTKQPELVREHGRNARKRIVEEFRNEIVWDALTEEYARLLKEKCGIELEVGRED